MATHWSSPPRASPEPELQLARRRNLATAARRSHLRPRHHHQSAPGEANRAAVPLIHLPRPHLAAGKLFPAVEGMDVNIQGYIYEPGALLQ
jgi:hypothetical protein